jgi:hypothetical protein
MEHRLPGGQHAGDERGQALRHADAFDAFLGLRETPFLAAGARTIFPAYKKRPWGLRSDAPEFVQTRTN